jgi:hypothetical protein
MRPFIALCAFVLILTGVFTGADARGAAVVPDFSAATFTPGAPIDNPYFPLPPGIVRRYEANLVDPDEPGAEPEALVIEDTVTTEFETVAGVQARVVRACEFVDELLVEDTRDYYAQDTAGNVWYLGEGSTAYDYDDEGNLIGTSTSGSWRAGVNGAEPGYIMPADRTTGFSYFQEHAPNDNAMDQATIVGFRDSVTVPARTFADVLDTLESNPLEPGSEEHKLYAPGGGLVLIEEDLDDASIPQPDPVGQRDPRRRHRHPAPAGGPAMFSLVAARWLRRRV